MEKESENLIKIKVAISLRRLLEKSKKTDQGKNSSIGIAKSYNDIAIFADFRKATVSDTFNAKHLSNFATIVMMVEAMGFDLVDFSKIYTSIEPDELERFKEGILLV